MAMKTTLPPDVFFPLSRLAKQWLKSKEDFFGGVFLLPFSRSPILLLAILAARAPQKKRGKPEMTRTAEGRSSFKMLFSISSEHLGVQDPTNATLKCLDDSMFNELKQTAAGIGLFT